MTSKNLLESFVAYLRHEQGLSVSTVTTYSHHLRSYLAFLDETDTESTNAKRERIVAYLSRLSERNLRPATIRQKGDRIVAAIPRYTHP